jgi:hypothetical protein
MQQFIKTYNVGLEVLPRGGSEQAMLRQVPAGGLRSGWRRAARGQRLDLSRLLHQLHLYRPRRHCQYLPYLFDSHLYSHHFTSVFVGYFQYISFVTCKRRI